MCDVTTGTEALDAPYTFTNARPRGDMAQGVGRIDLSWLWGQTDGDPDTERGIYPRLPVL